MFQTFTDLIAIFIGYPVCLLSLWAIGKYIGDNDPNRW